METIDKTAHIGHHTVAPTEPVSEQTVFLEAEIGSKRIREHQLAPSENRSYKSADGRVATEAAWLNGKNL